MTTLDDRVAHFRTTFPFAICDDGGMGVYYCKTKKEAEKMLVQAKARRTGTQILSTSALPDFAIEELVK